MVINYYDFEIKRYEETNDGKRVTPIIETGIVAAENYGHAAQLISDHYEDDFDEVNIHWHGANGVYLLDSFTIGDND